MERRYAVDARSDCSAPTQTLAADALGEDDHDAALQLGILDMWLERVQGAIDSLTTQGKA